MGYFLAPQLLFTLNLIIFLLLIPIFIIITFLISAVLEHHLETAFNLPGLSLPFIISVYIFVIFLTNYNHITPNIHQYGVDSVNFFNYYANILSQVSFLNNFSTGYNGRNNYYNCNLNFFKSAICSEHCFFCLNVLLLKFILPNHFDNLLILSSFNSILTAFALGGSLIIPSRKSFLLVIISSLMVVIFTGFFSRLLSGSLLPLLVLPFNFIVLATIYSLKFGKIRPILYCFISSPVHLKIIIIIIKKEKPDSKTSNIFFPNYLSLVSGKFPKDLTANTLIKTIGNMLGTLWLWIKMVPNFQMKGLTGRIITASVCLSFRLLMEKLCG